MKRRKAPWHSPSECSFDHGYRLGILRGKILAMERWIFLISPANIPNWLELNQELETLEERWKDWKKTRPK